MSNANNMDNTNNLSSTSKGNINQLIIVLVEKRRTEKWLAGKVGRDLATVSKWCTDIVQPNLYILRHVAFI